MKVETFFCDRCKKEIKKGMGVSVDIFPALSLDEIKKLIETQGEKGLVQKHLCNTCYLTIFDEKEAEYINKINNISASKGVPSAILNFNETTNKS